MAETKYPTLQGIGKWVKVFQPNQFGNWALDLYMTNEELDKFRELKVMNNIKKDDDGYFVHFKRPTEKEVRRLGGKKMGLSPPTVFDKNGQPMTNMAIGNGSKLTITLEHYGYKPPGQGQPTKYAVRLFSVRVDELVPYSTGDMSPQQQKAYEATVQRTPVW